jgi:hypothetical protein
MKAEQMKEQRKFMERIVITVVLTVILATWRCWPMVFRRLSEGT